MQDLDPEFERTKTEICDWIHVVRLVRAAKDVLELYGISGHRRDELQGAVKGLELHLQRKSDAHPRS